MKLGIKMNLNMMLIQKLSSFKIAGWKYLI